MPKLSIIITAYNAENYIRRCVESALASDGDYEVIAVDDCSQDRTGEILREYLPRIRLIELEKNNGSVAKTRNVGLENASGEYVTYLDADDWYESGAVGRILEYLGSAAPDILRFDYTLVYPDGSRKCPKNRLMSCGLVNKSEFKEKIYPRFIRGIDLNSVCLAVFRRGMLEGVRFSPQFKTAEDAAFSLEAYTRAENVMFVDEPLYCYYQSNAGLTGSAIGIAEKYRCNFLIAKKTLTLLGQWGMDMPLWRLRTVFRPIRLTFDKIVRDLTRGTAELKG